MPIASPSLTSTVAPGEGFGQFALPLDSTECMQHLINGTPIEIPRFFYAVLMRRIESYFSEAIIDTKMDWRIAQLTPVSCRLNNAGKQALSKPRTENRELRTAN